MKLLIAACTVLCFSAYGLMPDNPEHRENFGLLKMIDYCDLVVRGTVSSIDYVVRQGVLPDGGGAFTTDITLDVDEVLKGTPNAGKDTVKFMILGGEGVDTAGKKTRLIVTNQPEFAIDEDVVVFLKQGDAEYAGSFSRNFPHGRYGVVASTYGKRAVESGKISMLYGNVTNPKKPVEMPVTLAIKLGEAAKKDKDAAVLLENVIKNAVFAESGDIHTLAASMIDDLERRAQSIIDAPVQPEEGSK